MAGDGAEILLKAGSMRATVSPLGASLRRFWVEPADGKSRDILWGYAGTADKKGGQGDVLIPFPGRVAGAAYSFNGTHHALVTNDKQGPNAIHGLVRHLEWETGPGGPATAQFRTRIRPSDHAGYPFDLDVVVGYELWPTGLACAFVVRNAGKDAAPFGAGFHPYIAVEGFVDGAVLQVPASKLVEFDGLLPTGKLVAVPPALDFRVPRPVGATRLNHCLTDLAPGPDGFVRVRLGDVSLWMDRSFPFLVLYTGDSLGPDSRKALAVEPMTCATDAFNHPEWGLRVLPPGEVASGTWGIGLAV